MHILSFSFLAILVLSICQFVIETSGENSQNFLKHLKGNMRITENTDTRNVEKEINEDETKKYRHDFPINKETSSKFSDGVSKSESDIETDETQKRQYQHYRNRRNFNYESAQNGDSEFTQKLETNNSATEDVVLIPLHHETPNKLYSDVSTGNPSAQMNEVPNNVKVNDVREYEPQKATSNLLQNSAQVEANSTKFNNDGEKKDNVEKESNKIKNKEDETSSDCPTCGKNGLTEEEVKLVRANMFKDVLKGKLRSASGHAPMDGYQSDGRVPLPKLPLSILDRMTKDNEEEIKKDQFYAKDEEVIIPGEDMEGDCLKGNSMGCFTFSLSNKIKWEVAEAKLWFYKTKDLKDINAQTFTVTVLKRLKRGNLAKTPSVTREITLTRDGWITVNMTKTLIKWVSSKTDKQILAIQCTTCTARNYTELFRIEEYKPLLVVKYAKTVQAVRTKRSAACDPRYGCCLRDFTISFHEINMFEVYQPRNLSIGYCYGNCNEIQHVTYNHTMLIQNARYSSTNASQGTMFEQLKPCCVPLMLKDTFLMTVDDGMYVRKLVPKVIVESCGCV